MNILARIGERIAQLLARWKRDTPLPDRNTPPGRPELSTAPHEVVNDAQDYGVAITAAVVAPGSWYWQVVRVHHLTPEENRGNHHIYVDILDPMLGDGSNPNGARVYGARARVTWDGGEQIITVDKPQNEPGTNFPMWKWQVCAAEALGLPGLELPSDRVTGMHTGHPDEAPGNTLFHHSFSITFVKVQTPLTDDRDSVIYGLIHSAAGRTVRLLAGEEVVAEQVIGQDSAFRFIELVPGEYVVEVAGTGLRSEPVRLDGRNQVQLELTLVLAESVIRGHVRNGLGRSVTLLRGGEAVANQTVASDETFYFSGLLAGEYRVAVDGTSIVSGPLVVDGTNSASAELIVPTAGKTLGHYLLFGPADHPATEANLLLAREYILRFQSSFGFSAVEAAAAGMVTIIAAEDAVSPETAADLAADGTPVERIAGTVEDVAGALASRVASGVAFTPTG
jgi:hypothetical protein